MIVNKSAMKVGALVAAAGTFAATAQAAFLITAEAPGVTSSSVPGAVVETFDLAPHDSIGTYTGLTGSNVHAADQYGGVANSPHLDIEDTGGDNGMVMVDLGVTRDYFGMWWSAIHPGNTIEFFNGVASVQTVTNADVAGLLGAAGYDGNSEAPYAGQNSGEKYAFINFSGMDFDKIVFTQVGGGGFESDNHTVGNIRDVPDGGSLFGVFSAAIASLFWARRKVLRA